MHNHYEISVSKAETLPSLVSEFKLGAESKSVARSRIYSILFFILYLLIISPTGLGETELQCYSGQQYTFSAPCGDFLYLWNASAGSNEGTDQCLFLWTAPTLDLPAEVSISVLVSNRDLPSCNSKSEVNITVLPPSGCMIIAPELVCRNSTDNTATTPDAGPGASYMWTVKGGSITSGNGTDRINWTAGDAGLARISVTVTALNGSVSNCERQVSVAECEAPGITCPPDKTVCSDPGLAYATILPAGLGEASSNDPEARISSNAPLSNQYPVGETAITWAAENAAGERASCQQKIRVIDCSKPALELKITADAPVSVQAGEEINYTLELCNNGLVPLTDVILWDDLPDGVEIVSIYPEPQSGYTWNIGTLATGECYVIRLTLRIKQIDLRYSMSQRVRGMGFANVHNNYDTSTGPDSISNCAYATADNISTVSGCLAVKISNAGTSLKRSESGSGLYESVELPEVRSINHSIISASSLSAHYKPTRFSLPSGSSINYTSLWQQSSLSRNEITGTSISEEYSSASKIRTNRSIEQDTNGSKSITEAEFDGIGHISLLKTEPDSHATLAWRSEEDYAGSFQLRESVDAYASGLLFNSSTAGYGYAAADKSVGDRQRSYQSGTGSYSSEEIIETETGFISKNISLLYSPISFVYSPGLQANQSIRWSEGMWSESISSAAGQSILDRGLAYYAPHAQLNQCSSGSSLISERYSNLDRLQKETIVSGQGDVKTQSSFTGQADFRIKYAGQNGTDEVDSIESYFGSFEVNRHSMLKGLNRYDHPHLNVTTEGITRDDAQGLEKSTVHYNITVTNDGSHSLSPVYILDTFPPGSEYIRSSIRPAQLGPGQANWTVQGLGSGSSISISLVLNISGAAGGDMVNTVYACGSDGSDYICARNSLVLEGGSLACCPPQVDVRKDSMPDAADPAIVHNNITLVNNAHDAVAVTVTDQLPDGMALLYATPHPDQEDEDKLIWLLPVIMPGGWERIEYTALASRDGDYSSTVHIDAKALNGTGSYSSDVHSYVLVSREGSAMKTDRYGEWDPPSWNLGSHLEESFDDIIDRTEVEE